MWWLLRNEPTHCGTDGRCRSLNETSKFWKANLYGAFTRFAHAACSYSCKSPRDLGRTRKPCRTVFRPRSTGDRRSQSASSDPSAALASRPSAEVRQRTERTADQRTVLGFALDVVPQRVTLAVLHHEKRVVETHVVEVVHLAVDRRDQTGPAVAERSKRGHPVFATGASLHDVVVRHLIHQQRES